MSGSAALSKAPAFTRRRIEIGFPAPRSSPEGGANPFHDGEPVRAEGGSGYSVLVINSSQEMAREITKELTLGIPGCSIMYAPTIELARWIIKRRAIDLVVSCPVLPDGSIIKL